MQVWQDWNIRRGEAQREHHACLGEAFQQEGASLPVIPAERPLASALHFDLLYFKRSSISLLGEGRGGGGGGETEVGVWSESGALGCLWKPRSQLVELCGNLRTRNCQAKAP